jgi:hypothetical protein
MLQSVCSKAICEKQRDHRDRQDEGGAATADWLGRRAPEVTACARRARDQDGHGSANGKTRERRTLPLGPS